MAATLLDVLRLSTRHLAEHGSASPRLDAELLTAHALGLRRLDLYLQHDRPLDDGELAPIRELLRRRARGEPVAYLVGSREFYGRRFHVTADVLVPRPDTETLIEHALAAAAGRPRLRIADVGTGSGCIAVTLAAELPGATVDATDVSAAALAVARENAEAHGVMDRVVTLEGWFATPLAGRGPFDLMVSNPPYITSGEIPDLMRDVRDHEPRIALDGGLDGLDAYRAVVPAAAELLEPGGALLLEVDVERATAVARMVEAALAAHRVAVHPDLAGRARVVVALPR